ncbi:MAG TPA: hypothetical protein VHK69_12780, partial [Chitinophagaceae bacterium]|nr:hypothetical protein [Chitinophagaceae bacterium]
MDGFRAVWKQLPFYHRLQRTYRKVLFHRERARLQKAYAPLKGDGFTCNACGSRYREFAPSVAAPEYRGALERHAVIAGYGENCICPHCLSTSRDRLVIAALDRLPLEGKMILHLAPEAPVFRFLQS